MKGSQLLLEYKDLIGAIHFWVIWGAIVTGFLLVRDANIRWFIVFFAAVQGIAVQLAAPFAKIMGHPAFFHIWLVVCLSVFLKAIIFRPYICAKLSQHWAKLMHPFDLLLEWILPSKSVWVIYPAELGLQRIYKGFIFCHVLVLVNYFLAFLEITTRNGLLERHGFNRLIVWDLAYAVNTLLLILEIILFAFLVFRGLKNNFRLKL